MTDETHDPTDPSPESDAISSSEPMASPEASASNPGANPNLGGTPGPTPSSPPFSAPADPPMGSGYLQPPLDPVVPMSAMVSSEDKTQAMLCWVLCFFIGIISPVIFMLTGKEKPFVYRHAMQCLTFQLGVLIAMLIGGATVCIGIGVVIIGVAYVGSIVICIMAAIKAYNGEQYDPPLTTSLARKWFKVV